MRKIEHEICDKLKEVITYVRSVNEPKWRQYRLSKRDRIVVDADGWVQYVLWSTPIVTFKVRDGVVTTGSSMYWRSRTTNSRKRALQQVFGFPALDENITFDYISNI